MITFEKALSLVLDKAYKLEKEQIDIQVALNRVIAKDVISDIDMPPFDKSAMDGYACRKEDIHDILEIIEIIPAGKIPEKTISKNQCSKIMTGAMIPKGADCVLMVEQTELVGNNKMKFTSNHTNNNICYKSEDISKGETIISRGSILKPQHIAILASTGYAKPVVYKQPKVGVLSTGNELVEPSVIPSLSQIRNSNSYQLYAQVNVLRCLPNYYGIANDDKESLVNILKNSISDNDVTILTGGVSMGDFDLVPEILEQLNIKLIFKKIAIQPGKPTVFGMFENKFIFGLPGNPVSSFILFEMLVKPLLLKMMGNTLTFQNIKMPMGIEYERKRSDRKSFIPVKLTPEGTIVPVEYHGSAHINSLCNTDGIISLEIGKNQINKGEIVDVRLI
jgi:molybdopterin molybdotransferase